MQAGKKYTLYLTGLFVCLNCIKKKELELETTSICFQKKEIGMLLIRSPCKNSLLPLLVDGHVNTDQC